MTRGSINDCISDKNNGRQLFFKKSEKNIFTDNFMVGLEDKMMKLWVEQKKHGLKMVDFMLLSQC